MLMILAASVTVLTTLSSEGYLVVPNHLALRQVDGFGGKEIT